MTAYIPHHAGTTTRLRLRSRLTAAVRRAWWRLPFADDVTAWSRDKSADPFRAFREPDESWSPAREWGEKPSVASLYQFTPADLTGAVSPHLAAPVSTTEEPLDGRAAGAGPRAAAMALASTARSNRGGAVPVSPAVEVHHLATSPWPTDRSMADYYASWPMGDPGDFTESAWTKRSAAQLAIELAREATETGFARINPAGIVGYACSGITPRWEGAA